MQQPKIPTLQHFARMWNRSPDQICKKLVEMVESPPPFNYRPLHDAARDLLLFNIPEDQLASGIEQKEKRAWVRRNLLDALPLLCDHFGPPPVWWTVCLARGSPC